MNRARAHDEMLAELRRADPVDVDALASGTDPAPAQIMERILADTDTDTAAGVTALADRRAHRWTRLGPPRQRWLSAAAAAAVIAVVAAVTVVVYGIGAGRDATAAVHQAVKNTIAMSDSAVSSTTVTFDFDDFAEPWELTVEATFSEGNVAYQVTPGPAVADSGIPQLDSHAEIIVDAQAYRSTAGGPWEGPIPVDTFSREPGSALRSNLTFGVAIDDLGALFDFVDIGDEHLDGIAVAHYRTHATPAGAGAGLLMSLGMFMTMTDQEPTEQPDSVQLDVWVDSDDLIRRVSYIAEVDGTGSFRVVTDWDSFAQAPSITAPEN